MKYDQLHFFDPKAEWSIVERALPHWSQSGVITFITWRLADSLPKEVLNQLDHDIATILRSEGLNPDSDWQQELGKRANKKRMLIERRLFNIRDKYLDKGFGECQLAIPGIGNLVLDSLRRFDEERYILADAVIMPNHVHFLCMFAGSTEMLKQCTEWKRYTGRQINERTNRRGELWQVDQFDHLVRNPEQFEYYRRYIAENPQKARLRSAAYLHYQKDLQP